MALPPGFVTAIWPAAGIALGCFLLWQPKNVWPGVLVGSFVTNATIIPDSSYITLALAIAAGSTLQSFAAMFALSFTDKDARFEQWRAVIKSYGALILSCLIAPTLGNAALLLSNQISTEQLFSSFLTWWFGDAMGTLIFMPLMLLLFDQRTVWRERRLATGVPLVTAFTICVLLYHYSYSNQQQQLSHRFAAKTNELVAKISEYFKDNIEHLSSLSHLVVANEKIDFEGLNEFHQHMKSHNPSLVDMGWAVQEVVADVDIWTVSRFSERGSQSQDNINGLLLAHYIDQEQPALLKGKMRVVYTLNDNDERNLQSLVILNGVVREQHLVGVNFTEIIYPMLAGFIEETPNLQWQVVDKEIQSILFSNFESTIPTFTDSILFEANGIYAQHQLNLANKKWTIVFYLPYSSFMTSNMTLVVMMLSFMICGVVVGVTLITSGERNRIQQQVIEKTQHLSLEIAQREVVEQELIQKEERYHRLFSDSPVGHFVTSLHDDRLLEVNQAFAGLTGYSIKELTKLTVHQLIADKSENLFNERAQLESTGKYGPVNQTLLRRDGAMIGIRVSSIVLKSISHDTVVLTVVEDISALEESKNKLTLLAKVFEHSGEAILITDHKNRIIEVNQSFTDITGYTLDEIRGQNPKVLSAGNTSEKDYRTMWAAINGRGFWQGEMWDRHKNGSVFPKWLTVSVLKDTNEQVTHYIGSFTDITEKKEAEQRIYNLAHHDPLTQLPNRFNLQLKLEQVFARAKRAPYQLAILFIDLDRFKLVNDTLGHHIGDKLLVDVAQRIKSIVRESDIIARIGGDEFVVVLTDIDINSAKNICSKIIKRLTAPYSIESNVVHSSPSIGVSIYPDDGVSVEELMKHADTAMYKAKASGRNNYKFFKKSMNLEIAEKTRIETELRAAIENNELILHFQPQIDIATREIVAVEALVRWNSVTLGFMTPNKFIPIAEESGLIKDLGAWVLRQALLQLSKWSEQGLENLRMAINISAQQLHDESIIELLADSKAEFDLEEHLIELEITEGVAMQHPERNYILLEHLRQQGVQLAIDDFGTGYSSLSYLKLLPLDRLKLDRSFVRDIEHDSNDAAICAATISLAHSLGLTVVAEGVETEEQLNFLTDLGCDIAQGFYFAKPLPATECFELIMQWQKK